MKKILISLIGFVLVMSCTKDNPSEILTLPSKLAVKTIISEDGTGQVSVVATAEEANFYTIYFGENVTLPGVVSADGKASYTYASTGTYTIRVQAHVTQSEFISDVSSVYVTSTSVDGILIPASGTTSPLAYTGKSLVWQDEFDGSALNTSNWKHELGAGGWGNNELQFYRQENTKVAKGYLIITAKEEAFQGSKYTSSRIISSGLREFKYGRIDIRAALPKGQGIWPAAWMLGANINTVPWPACGEIDIMEMIGGNGRENEIFGTAHWANASNARELFSGKTKLATGTFADSFHIFSIEWNSTSITWYLDNVQYHRIDTTPANLSEFQNAFFFIFNIAVGGDLPGSPNTTTTFPQNFIVDYVRVFQ
jgi:beta-glucanase (GH16 family)